MLYILCACCSLNVGGSTDGHSLQFQEIRKTFLSKKLASHSAEKVTTAFVYICHLSFIIYRLSFIISTYDSVGFIIIQNFNFYNFLISHLYIIIYTSHSLIHCSNKKLDKALNLLQYPETMIYLRSLNTSPTNIPQQHGSHERRLSNN